ncbi:MAG: hypothetical protein HUU06_10140 [Planctomycetaceae bacterium]|nr:hypothetical protein [Planctomycetota bacterium]NUN53129.1 hypothetical protein [Planctomycetaceae bacterium]
MPHSCEAGFWGYPADELMVELEGQYEARNGLRGWGLIYDDPLAYLAGVSLLGELNVALGWWTQSPGPWIGEFFPAGDVKEWANAMAGSLVLDRLDDSVNMNIRHSTTAFGWIRTREGNNPNPAAVARLKTVHKRIRDMLDVLRLDDKGNPIPEPVMKGKKPRRGRRGRRNRNGCPNCAARAGSQDPGRRKWSRLLGRGGKRKPRGRKRGRK